MSTATHPVSEAAIIRRINRKLAHETQSLHRCRPGSRWWSDLGDYYIVDDARNAIVATHVSLEDTARELGILGMAESLV